MRCEARFRAVGACTLRGSGNSSGPWQGHPRPRTADKEWSCDRPPLRAPHAYGPDRAPPGPRDRREQAEKPPAPEPQRRPLREKASWPTPTAASPPATCSTSFKQFRHAATAQVPTRPPAPHTSARPPGCRRMTGRRVCDHAGEIRVLLGLCPRSCLRAAAGSPGWPAERRGGPGSPAWRIGGAAYPGLGTAGAGYAVANIRESPWPTLDRSGGRQVAVAADRAVAPRDDSCGRAGGRLDRIVTSDYSVVNNHDRL
jgi:hypothetical protein